jgi:hypothetical protein
MAGTTMSELQELDAWKSEAMLRCYAYFAPEQLRAAAFLQLLKFARSLTTQHRFASLHPDD